MPAPVFHGWVFLRENNVPKVIYQLMTELEIEIRPLFTRVLLPLSHKIRREEDRVVNRGSAEAEEEAQEPRTAF